MILVALLYYQNEKKLYFDLTKTKMQNVASNISSRIILVHMSGKKTPIEDLLFEDDYNFSLYDSNKTKIYGKIQDKLDFSKKIIEKDKYFILTDNSTYGHLGVSYIAIKDNSFYKTLNELKTNIILIFLIIYSILALVGFYLAKLFLKPIKDEREKLNTFIKDTTHELNTPISAILMSSETEELSNKQVTRIKLAAQKISEIYKDLTYTFLEERDEEIDLKEISLNQVITQQLKYFEVLAEKKKIKLITDLEDTKFKIDENDFTRLFNNIVSNAIKYNKKSGFVEITLKNKKLIIKDNGIGIEDKKIKDIFNRYYRATKDSGGFGIGLNIVQNICLKYNIKFNVQSKLKEGSTFSFDF
ncbi:HAMP domain-containing sensor histidine kinase [Arcobacter sp. LA11]|uniref:sensor histidine kinase n=1 Tax=Arcobacter sp. LA11 TaxID=1898176 RepID=UPI0009351137|nr:HAMP domain-containing sensor histidine kinase [Arcobacter sp. LA11]